MTEDATHEGCDELGLPLPKKYDGPRWDVREYLTDTYEEARTLEEAIEMRGQDAFAREIEPTDFDDDIHAHEIKLGLAELWADSTWHEGASQRDVELEQTVAAIQPGNLIEIRESPAQDGDFEFFLPNGKPLPYAPYHDYDYQFFARAFAKCGPGERLACRVRSVACYGGNNDVPVDPTFCWRVYSCKVTVFKRIWSPRDN